MPASTEAQALDLLSEFAPPLKLGFAGDGSPDYSSFGHTGARFFHHLTTLGGLKPTDKVLEVGCAIGRMALHLIPYLRDQGQYEGFDINPIGITWCSRKIAGRFPRFRFQLADVYNRQYNPIGTHKASEYRFPYQDSFFDFVYLTSVFTHMLPLDLSNYLGEIARVLRPGGTCLISYLLLNDESRALNDSSGSPRRLKHTVGKVAFNSETLPEGFIGYDEELVLALYRQVGLEVIPPVHYGNWCGRSKHLEYQDFVLARKPERTAPAGAASAKLQKELSDLHEQIDWISKTASRPEPILTSFCEEAQRIVPDNSVAVVAGASGTDLTDFGRRRLWAFPEWEEPKGFPAGTAEALDRLQTARSRGAEYLLFAPPAFFLLRDHPEFRRELDRLYWCVGFNENCIAYQFAEPHRETATDSLKVAISQWGVLEPDAEPNLISGWAWNSAQPDAPVEVDIYDGEEKIATVKANEFRQDLLDDGIGDGKHGFSLPVPVNLRDGQIRRVSARIAASGVILANSPLEARWEQALTETGQLEEGTADFIAGWAWNSTAPDAPVEVDIYDADTKIATVTANEFRQDLLDDGIGNGKHGFTYLIPESLKDGSSHLLAAKIAGSDIPLSDSPLEIKSAGPPPTGEVDMCTPEFVSGWVWDPTRPEAAVALDIYDGPQLLAQITAALLREDLRKAGFGDGRHGFTFAFDPPLPQDSPHEISVRVAGTDIHLANSPTRLSTTPAA